MDYSIDWQLVADANPYTHADFTMANGTVKLVSGDLFPVSSDVYIKMCFTGTAMDWSKSTMVARVVLGVDPSEYYDAGGPAFIVPSGTDKGKGYLIKQQGNNIALQKADTETGEGSWAYTFGNINTETGESVAPGGELDLELGSIGGTATLRAYYNGTRVGGTYNPSAYISAEELVPALFCVWGSYNYSGWRGFQASGLDLGGFTISDVDTNDIIYTGDAFTINGAFDSTTITSIKIKQTGATDKTVSFSETDTALSCTAIDFHTTSIFPGAATIEVTDGTDTHTLDVTIVFTNDFIETVAVSISQTGAFKDISGAVAGDIAHITKQFGGSDVSVNANGVLTSHNPSTPNGTTGVWWHGAVASNTWTIINATINQFDVDGPVWVAPSAWPVISGRSSQYDISEAATASAGGGVVRDYTIVPAVAGFTIAAATGVIDFDGTPAIGHHWLTITATDDNGTTTAPQLQVTVGENPLSISNTRATSITQTTATITVDALTPSGDIYIAVRDSGPYTDAANIKAGTGAAFAQNRPGALAVQFYPAGLTANKLYYYSLVQADGANDSNIISGTFTTQADIAFTETGKAPSVRPY